MAVQVTQLIPQEMGVQDDPEKPESHSEQAPPEDEQVRQFAMVAAQHAPLQEPLAHVEDTEQEEPAERSGAAQS